MITTGKQTTDEGPYTPLDVASSRLQSKGAAVFVLGIGKDVEPSELIQIASGPKNMFTVDSFEDLNDKANELKRGICILGMYKLFVFHALLKNNLCFCCVGYVGSLKLERPRFDVSVLILFSFLLDTRRDTITLNLYRSS